MNTVWYLRIVKGKIIKIKKMKKYLNKKKKKSLTNRESKINQESIKLIILRRIPGYIYKKNIDNDKSLDQV